MDIRLLRYWNRTLASPELDWVMIFLSIVVPVLILIAILIVWRHYHRRTGYLLFLTVLIALAAATILQYLGNRPRPVDIRELLPVPPFPSYPSGHATTAFALATLILLQYRRFPATLAAFALAGAIALSRVYLGHHWPSDIAGGLVLGISIGAAMYGLFVEKKTGRPGWRWLLWPQIALIIVLTQMAYLNYLPFHLLQWQYADKVMHFLLFGSVAFWLNIWLQGKSVRLLGLAVPLAILIPLAVALVDEFFQHFSPVRTADPLDLYSDIAGLFFFWLLSLMFVWREPGAVSREKAAGARRQSREIPQRRESRDEP